MATGPIKKITELTAEDLRAFPVWEYVNDDECGETAVRPVKKIPVPNFTNRIIGTEVVLSNGSSRQALIGNVDATHARLTEHFLTLSLLERGRWFDLARYHDLDAAERGPKGLAAFLKLPVDEVFQSPTTSAVTASAIAKR